MSGSWSAGYVTEVEYTYGFYREMTPEIIRVSLLARNVGGVDRPATLNYCELGCGQGVTANVIAAANPNIQVYATDFNPAQIHGAQMLARDAGLANVHFYDQSFQEFIDNPDLPTFDIIGLHGIYSWINKENRQAIVRFIHRHLRPGGVVYISYNTMPGWAAVMPLRRLMADHVGASGGSVVGGVDAALKFANDLKAADARYFKVNPILEQKLDGMGKQPRAYIAHEYLNSDWTPFYYADVVDELSEAKLTWAGSANLLDNIDIVSLTAAHQKLLSQVTDVTRRESLRDYLVNQQFRRDIFVKGLRTGVSADIRDAWLNTRLALTLRAVDVPTSVTTAAGQAQLQADLYGPILQSLDQGPKLLSEIVPLVPGDHAYHRVQQAVMILIGAGFITPCPDATGDAGRRVHTDRFNLVLMQQARGVANVNYLASPVTGAAVPVERIHQLFMLAARLGREPAAFAWESLDRLGQRLVHEGQTMNTAAENMAALTQRHAVYAEKWLPVYTRLGLV